MGLIREVVETKLARVELEATGPRLPKDMAVLEKQRPVMDAPPPGAEGTPRWGEYVAYYEKRLEELKQGTAVEGPLRWVPYEQILKRANWPEGHLASRHSASRVAISRSSPGMQTR